MLTSLDYATADYFGPTDAELTERARRARELAARKERDDRSVLTYLRSSREPQRRQWVREGTGLDYDRINDALDRLTLRGLVRRDGAGVFDLYRAVEE